MILTNVLKKVRAISNRFIKVVISYWLVLILVIAYVIALLKFPEPLTPTIALTTALILYFQYRLAQQRWRLDLYEKRYPIYLLTMTFLSKISSDAAVTHEEILKFARDSKEKEFLFDSDVEQLLSEIERKASRLRFTQTEYKDLPVGKARDDLVEEEYELLEWLDKQRVVCRKIFGSYLLIKEK